jgi:hypothetical protein
VHRAPLIEEIVLYSLCVLVPLSKISDIWFKQYSVCLTSTKSLVQTPVLLPNKLKSIARVVLFTNKKCTILKNQFRKAFIRVRYSSTCL